MRMKWVFAAGALLLALTPNFAVAQEYYTLPEIREQAKDGWHETYTDRYGRETVVDIDVEVYGGENAPILQAGWLNVEDEKDRQFQAQQNLPNGKLKEARLKRGGETCYLYEDVPDMKIDLEEKYGEAYGNDWTVREIYDFVKTRLNEIGVPSDEWHYEMPYKFSVGYSISKKNGEVLVPPIYIIFLREKQNDMPIWCSVTESYLKSAGPYLMPNMMLVMQNEEEYDISGFYVETKKVLADDIALCSLEKVIQSAEKQIKAGFIQNVVSLRFGYVVYNDPNIKNVERASGLDAECYYLVPSWVMECAFVENPKKDYQSYWESKNRMMTVNAQTGEMLDYFDRSYKGYGDARYKGFIPWDKVK